MLTRLLFSLCMLGSVAGLQADPFRHDADWLKTIAFAARNTDYSGVFVYQAGANGRVEVSRISHVNDATGEYERLESLDGVRREVFRHNDQVWLSVGEQKPRRARRRHERAFPALLPEQLHAVQENYLIRQTEEDRVAGYHAHTVLFQPKDNLRYTHKMWAHSQTGLLLKATVSDEHGRLIEQYAFTQLAIGGNIDRKWIAQSGLDVTALQSASQPLAPLPKAGEVLASSSWQVDAMPPGFRKVLEMQRSMRGKNKPVVHMVYSDGLAGVSIFIEEAGAEAPNGLISQGATQVYSRLLGDKLITVVGEVPPRTVIQIADSVRYAGQ